MTRLAIAAFFFLFSFNAAAAELGSLMDQATSATSGSVTSALASQFGMTDTQAEGGIGSILSLAQNKLKAGDFDTVINSIPGGAGYMDTAKQLGLLDVPLENLGGLTSALSSLGLPAQSVTDFIPVAGKALGSIGGPEVSQLLSSVLSPG